jgi:hypothetical protein
VCRANATRESAERTQRAPRSASPGIVRKFRKTNPLRARRHMAQHSGPDLAERSHGAPTTHRTAPFHGRGATARLDPTDPSRAPPVKPGRTRTDGAEPKAPKRVPRPPPRRRCNLSRGPGLGYNFAHPTEPRGWTPRRSGWWNC